VDPGIEQAVERASKGDAEAFDVIVREYGSSLVRFLAGVLAGDVHAAHDVAQDAFLAAWRALPSLEHPRLLRAWIYRVAYNRAISWLRRRGPRGTPFVALERDASGGPEAVARHEPEGSSSVTPRLRAALSALPPPYAAAVTLYYFQGLGTIETAEALGVSRSTVKMRLHRARTVLRKTLLPKPAPPAPAKPSGARPKRTRRGGKSAGCEKARASRAPESPLPRSAS
jgi:RNA polymerase sigma-70 factor (ECF subfamily)